MMDILGLLLNKNGARDSFGSNPLGGLGDLLIPKTMESMRNNGSTPGTHMEGGDGHTYGGGSDAFMGMLSGIAPRTSAPSSVTRMSSHTNLQRDNQPDPSQRLLASFASKGGAGG